jgi:hypothetical protein
MASFDPRLEQLQRDLSAIRRGGLARQEDMAMALSLDQETISKAKNGRLKRWTKSTEAMQEYANMLLGKQSLSKNVQLRARAFLASGGKEETLCAILDVATDIVVGRK